MGSLASTAILTQGLTCGQVDACTSGAVITTPSDLFCVQEQFLAPGSGGGGPYPYPAWNRLEPGEAQKFFQPIDSIDELKDLFKPLQQNTATPFYIVPYNQIDYSQHHQIVTDITIDGEQKVRSFNVPKDKPGTVEIKNLQSTKIRPRVGKVMKKRPRVGEVKKKQPRIKGLHKDKPQITKFRNKYNNDDNNEDQ